LYTPSDASPELRSARALVACQQTTSLCEPLLLKAASAPSQHHPCLPLANSRKAVASSITDACGLALARPVRRHPSCKLPALTIGLRHMSRAGAGCVSSVELQLRWLARTLSVAVRSVSCQCHGWYEHIADNWWVRLLDIERDPAVTPPTAADMVLGRWKCSSRPSAARAQPVGCQNYAHIL
jgi:hypothetical protein